MILYTRTRHFFVVNNYALPEDEAGSVDWFEHDDLALAMAHARRLQRMTGDRCLVRKYGPSRYRVLRYDVTNKPVSDCC